jgi:hypothetical protein
MTSLGHNKVGRRERVGRGLFNRSAVERVEVREWRSCSSLVRRMKRDPAK